MNKKIVIPGPYPIKIITEGRDETTEKVLEVVKNNFPEHDTDKTKHNPSKGNQYVSTTVHVHVDHEDQLKKLHEELKAIPGVIMVL